MYVVVQFYNIIYRNIFFWKKIFSLFFTILGIPKFVLILTHFNYRRAIDFFLIIIKMEIS